jgi:DNA-binding CsgD family transcriptional regulator
MLPQPYVICYKNRQPLLVCGETQILMDTRSEDTISSDQIRQLFRYLLREASMRDYLELYPDMEQRFPALIAAMPDQFVADTLRALEQTETPETSAEKLAQTFGLTEAESALCLLLIAGHTLSDIAGIRKISRHTVRNHMQNTYDKTMTRKQPELIRRLHDLLDEK